MALLTNAAMAPHALASHISPRGSAAAASLSSSRRRLHPAAVPIAIHRCRCRAVHDATSADAAADDAEAEADAAAGAAAAAAYAPTLAAAIAGFAPTHAAVAAAAAADALEKHGRGLHSLSSELNLRTFGTHRLR